MCGFDRDTSGSEATAELAVLRHVGPTGASERVVIDATRLQFVDHRALCALEDFARTHDTTVVLRGAHGVATTICALLELDRVVVADAA